MMNIERKEINNILVIKPLFKNLDVLTATSFKSQIIQELEAGYDKMIIDLSLVTFMDTAGLGTLINIYKMLPSKDRLHICGLTACVKTLFELAGMMNLFNIYPTLDQALIY